jgi:nicotinate-nucleotide adenylyltransferase
MLETKKKGIGIFGGSFDPPHKGHIKISKISLKKIKLKKIYWIITKKNPFKKKTYFSLKQRMQKSNQSLKKLNDVKVLYLEERIRSSRMIKVIDYFRKTKKKNDLYLILGSDNLIHFHKWTSWKKIVKLSKLVVFSRRGYDKKSKDSTVVKYLDKKNIIFINNKLIDISSSEIKKIIEKKRNENN